MERLFARRSSGDQSSPGAGRHRRSHGPGSRASTVARCRAATSACCSSSRRSGARRSSSSSSASTSSSRRSSSSAALAVGARRARCRSSLLRGGAHGLGPTSGRSSSSAHSTTPCRSGCSALPRHGSTPGSTAVIQAAAPIFTVAPRRPVRSEPGGPGRPARRRRRRLRSVWRCSSACRRAASSSAPSPCSGPRSATRSSVLYAAAPCAGLPPLKVSARPARVCGRSCRAVRRSRSSPTSSRRPTCSSAIAALGALGSGIAYLLYFALIASAGASRAILVTYLVPAFALSTAPSSSTSRSRLGARRALALVLAGTALATGALRRRR